MGVQEVVAVDERLRLRGHAVVVDRRGENGAVGGAELVKNHRDVVLDLALLVAGAAVMAAAPLDLVLAQDDLLDLASAGFRFIQRLVDEVVGVPRRSRTSYNRHNFHRSPRSLEKLSAVSD